jgi:predicted dehydrogenase
VKFEGGKSMELAAAWAINQPPAQNGAICRAYGQDGAIEVYTPEGAVLYRGFEAKGEAKAVALKPPKLTHQTALLRHFRQCILAGTPPEIGPAQGISLMAMVDAIYRSAANGKSAVIR